MHTPIEQLLNGDEAVEAAPEVVAEPESSEPEVVESADADQAEAEAQEATDAAETPGEEDASTQATGEEIDVTPASEDKVTSGQLAALLDERDKRQRAEARTQELETQIQQQAQAAERPDEFDDPDGARQWDRNQQDQQMINMKVNLSWDMASASISDFEDVMKAEWAAATAENPQLVQLAYQQNNPAKWAYDRMKDRTTLREVGDVDAFRKKIFDEAVQEAKAQLQKTTDNPPVDLPETLADENSAGNQRSGPAWAGPTPLSELLPDPADAG